MKILKFKNPHRHKPLKTALAKYKSEINKIKQKLIVVAKDYKEAVDKERMMVAEKRNNFKKF